MLHPRWVSVVTHPTSKSRIPSPGMRMHSVFVTYPHGLRDLGMVLSQCPVGRPVHYLNLGIHPPEPIQPDRRSGCVRQMKAELLQVWVEPFEAPPRGGLFGVWTLGIRLDVDAQNHRNAFFHSLCSVVDALEKRGGSKSHGRPYTSGLLLGHHTDAKHTHYHCLIHIHFFLGCGMKDCLPRPKSPLQPYLQNLNFHA